MFVLLCFCLVFYSFVVVFLYIYIYNEIQADPCDTACDLSTRHLLFPRDFAAPAGFKGCSVVKHWHDFHLCNRGSLKICASHTE